MRKVASVLLGLSALGHAVAQKDHPTNHLATELQAWEKLVGPSAEVTCNVACYRRASDDEFVPVAEAQRTTNLVVNGVVLSVVEPAQFKGKVVTFHFDFPEECEQWYLPDFHYRGQIRTDVIGRTNFLCDPGCFAPIARPLPSSDPESLKKLIRHRIWGEHFAAAIKEQLGEKALFGMLYSFLTDTNWSPTQFGDQKTAARLLVRVRPVCNVSLKRAIEETLSTWNVSVSDWPLYLWRSFSRNEILGTLDKVDTSKLSVTEREGLDAWRYWLSGEEKDLVEKP
jgi:hypothetical protein